MKFLWNRNQNVILQGTFKIIHEYLRYLSLTKKNGDNSAIGLMFYLAAFLVFWFTETSSLFIHKI